MYRIRKNDSQELRDLKRKFNVLQRRSQDLENMIFTLDGSQEARNELDEFDAYLLLDNQGYEVQSRIPWRSFLDKVAPIALTIFKEQLEISLNEMGSISSQINKPKILTK